LMEAEDVWAVKILLSRDKTSSWVGDDVVIK
jgi:hypothetical protein